MYTYAVTILIPFTFHISHLTHKSIALFQLLTLIHSLYYIYLSTHRCLNAIIFIMHFHCGNKIHWPTPTHCPQSDSFCPRSWSVLVSEIMRQSELLLSVGNLLEWLGSLSSERGGETFLLLLHKRWDNRNGITVSITTISARLWTLTQWGL